MSALAVWWGERLVGRVLGNGAGLSGFVYDGDWLQDGQSVSCSLPLDETGDFLLPDTRGVHFFGNLLPEGNARDRLVRRLGVADDDFRLLERLGGDCAGALSLRPEAEVQPASRLAGRHVLSEEDLQRAIRLGGSAAWIPGEGEEAPRLSLAGAQDKIPVCLGTPRPDGGEAFELPTGDTASTHILKLPVNDLHHVPLYECYTTFMAERLQLPVASIRPVVIAGHVCSLSTRYDRQQHDGVICRLHQEDFCQVLGRSRSEKYADSGAHPGLVAGALREHSNTPAGDLQALIRWQVFNALAGNSDGHLKNLALLAQEGGGWKLAPFYDLVCVLAIENVSHRLALPVGSMQDMGSLTARHWAEFAGQVGVAGRTVSEAIRMLAERLHDQLEHWHEAFQQQYGEYPVLERPRQVLRQQVKKALRDWV